MLDVDNPLADTETDAPTVASDSIENGVTGDGAAGGVDERAHDICWKRGLGVEPPV